VEISLRIFIILIAVALVLGGCDFNDEAGKPNQVLHVVNHVTSEPASLDPLLVNDIGSGEVLYHVMEGLVRLDREGNPRPGMAKSWKASADMKKFTFELRAAEWSNGDRVTAHDFEYQWKRMLSPENKGKSMFSYKLYCIKNGEKFQQGEAEADDVGVKALDDDTLEVTLEQPAPYFPSLVGNYAFYPVDKKVVENNPDWSREATSYVGNGPFKLKEWNHDEKIVLEKNERFWNAKEVKLEEIEFPFISSPTTAYQMFLSKKLNYLGSGAIPTDLLPALTKEGKVQNHPILGTYVYKMNVEQPPFDNQKIRLAFSMAIDREQLSENLLQSGQQAAVSWVPWKMPDPVEKKEFYQVTKPVLTPRAQAEKAKKLLEEGMREEGIRQLPEITLDYSNSETNKKIAEAVQQMWKKTLQTEVKLRGSESKVYLAKLASKNYQIASMGWVSDFNDPVVFIDCFVTDAGANETNWSNKEYDRLVDTVKSSPDQRIRMRAMHKAEEILMNEAPIMPIFYLTESSMADKSVKNVVVTIGGTTDYTYAYIKE
jgi:oligopeptide transport system substrate-binding protein